MDTVIKEALNLMGVNSEDVIILGNQTYVNGALTSRADNLSFYGCYYIDDNYGWSFDSSKDGVSFYLVDYEEIESGYATDVDSEEAVTSDYDGLKNFNRRKFRLAMEKLCEEFDRNSLSVNIQFATPSGDGKSEVVFVQILSGTKDCWIM